MPTDKLYVISTLQLWCIKVEEMYLKYFDAKQHSINEGYQNRLKIQVGNCSPTQRLKINEK